ncbi:MAG: DUF2953 domain-containing protein [Eubacteriales bacterium]|nr:DUF2953 domain-containing protein [Eubacteriales bacterium]
MLIALLIIAAIIIIAVGIVFLIPIRAIISFYKNPNGAGLEIAFMLAFFRFKIHPSEKKPKKQVKKKTTSPPKQKKTLKEKITGGIDLYNLISDDARGIISYIVHNAFCFENLSFYLHYGTGDAASTGILYGVISGIVYGLFGAIANSSKTKKSEITINPDFNAAVFETNGECIVKIRNVHIIVIAVKLLKLYLKIKKRKGT